MTDDVPREGITTTQRIGPWAVTMYRPIGFAAGGPQEIRVEPAGDADPQEIARGISSTVLRQIVTATPGELARQASEEPALDDLSDTLRQMPRGLSDEYLAFLSAVYVRVVEVGQRAPIQDLEQVTGTKQATLKGHLRAARQRGFLTKVEGKAGGQLTDKAHNVLKRVQPGGVTAEDAR
ncbi:hypothetical protein ACFRCX_14920 [Streptomyces sp. NPDC056652]|uniref:hypothetical protein n=1 Tax=Streptomyces sp. NPDC056652 TaxID=3345893 RepID=UPI00369B687A